MITLEQFKEAQKLIEDYEEQLRQTHVTSRVCMCCKKTIIEPLYGEPPILKQQEGMWNNGTVALLSFGFGSRNDLQSYYVAICDDCIDEAEKSGAATNYKSLIELCRKHGL